MPQNWVCRNCSESIVIWVNHARWTKWNTFAGHQYNTVRNKRLTNVRHATIDFLSDFHVFQNSYNTEALKLSRNRHFLIILRQNSMGPDNGIILFVMLPAYTIWASSFTFDQNIVVHFLCYPGLRIFILIRKTNVDSKQEVGWFVPRLFFYHLPTGDFDILNVFHATVPFCILNECSSVAFAL